MIKIVNGHSAIPFHSPPVTMAHITEPQTTAKVILQTSVGPLDIELWTKCVNHFSVISLSTFTFAFAPQAPHTPLSAINSYFQLFDLPGFPQSPYSCHNYPMIDLAMIACMH